MKYIDYKNMKPFYSISEVARIFEMDKNSLRAYADKYSIYPVQDQFDNWGFRDFQVRKLHNYIYKEQKNSTAWDTGAYYNEPKRADDPWA